MKVKKGNNPSPTNPPGPPPNFTPPSPPPENLRFPYRKKSRALLSSEKDSNSSSADQELTKKKADREAEIARVKSSNAQKQKEFNDKVAEAQKVRELNENLADWYYVISNEV